MQILTGPLWAAQQKLTRNLGFIKNIYIYILLFNFTRGNLHWFFERPAYVQNIDFFVVLIFFVDFLDWLATYWRSIGAQIICILYNIVSYKNVKSSNRKFLKISLPSNLAASSQFRVNHATPMISHQHQVFSSNRFYIMGILR